MTKEESKAILQTMEYELSNQVGSAYCRKKYDAVKIAIKALEQEPCEDCISRQAVDRLAREYLKKGTDENVAFYEHFLDLPSVIPQPKTGHWIEKYAEDACGERYSY